MNMPLNVTQILIMEIKFQVNIRHSYLFSKMINFFFLPALKAFIFYPPRLSFFNRVPYLKICERNHFAIPTSINSKRKHYSNWANLK